MAVYPGLGERIRTLRQHRGMTLKQLADIIGVEWETLQRIETEKKGTDLNKIHDIAQALGTTVKFLLPDEDAPPVEDVDRIFLRQRGFTEQNTQEILDFMEFIKAKEKKNNSSDDK